MRLLRLSGWLFVLILLVTAAVGILGGRLPADHTATASALIPASQQRTWQLLTDLPAQTSWRSGLRAIELLPDSNGHPCWREVSNTISLPLCVTSDQPPRHRVVTIADPKLPVAGTWTYNLVPQSPNQTRLTVTEHTTTGPALWRFVGHYITGEDTTLHRLLADLTQAAQTPPAQTR